MKLVFDARFKDSNGVGQDVDSDMYVEFCVEGTTAPVMLRRLGDDQFKHVVRTTDTNGVYYVTVVDGSELLRGNVTAHWYAKRNGTPIQPYPLSETLLNVSGDELSVATVKDYVFSMLGFPVVDVELTDTQFSFILEDALSLYSQFVPMEAAVFFELLVGKHDYQFADLPSSGPFDVQFVRKQGMPFLNDALFGREFPRAHMISFEEYALSISYWELVRRVTSTEPEWYWDETDHTLVINTGYKNLVTPYSQHLCMARFFKRRSVNNVRPEHKNWFMKYALAQSKKVLAQIRGKFSGEIPAPGGRMKMGYQLLAEEGAREEEALMEKLRDMANRVPPVLG